MFFISYKLFSFQSHRYGLTPQAIVFAIPFLSSFILFTLFRSSNIYKDRLATLKSNASSPSLFQLNKQQSLKHQIWGTPCCSLRKRSALSWGFINQILSLTTCYINEIIEKPWFVSIVSMSCEPVIPNQGSIVLQDWKKGHTQIYSPLCILWEYLMKVQHFCWKALQLKNVKFDINIHLGKKVDYNKIHKWRGLSYWSVIQFSAFLDDSRSSH